MNVYYESDQRLSIYDSTLDCRWLSVNRYYSITYPFREMECLHAHTEVEIMYVAGGKCTINLEDGCIALKGGDYIFLDSLVPHSLSVEENSPCYMLNLEASLTRQDGIIRLDTLLGNEKFRNFHEHAPPILICRDDDGTVKNGIINLHRLLLHQDSPIEVDLQLSLILLEIGRHCFSKRMKNPQQMMLYVKRAINFIAQNFDRELTVDDVAAEVGISKAHLQRTFRSSQGCTVIEMINRFRLDKAKQLLASSSCPIVEIANEVGFSSRQYFTDLFVRCVGVSPAKYRKHQRGNMAAGFNDADLGVELSYKY